MVCVTLMESQHLPLWFVTLMESNAYLYGVCVCDLDGIKRLPLWCV